METRSSYISKSSQGSNPSLEVEITMPANMDYSSTSKKTKYSEKAAENGRGGDSRGESEGRGGVGGQQGNVWLLQQASDARFHGGWQDVLSTKGHSPLLLPPPLRLQQPPARGGHLGAFWLLRWEKE